MNYETIFSLIIGPLGTTLVPIIIKLIFIVKRLNNTIKTLQLEIENLTNVINNTEKKE